MDGVSYPLIDWNPGGFQIAPFSGKVRGNQKVSVRVIIPHKGETLGFNLTAQIKRIDPVNKAIGGVFVDVDKSIGTKMRALFSERLK